MRRWICFFIVSLFFKLNRNRTSFTNFTQSWTHPLEGSRLRRRWNGKRARWRKGDELKGTWREKNCLNKLAPPPLISWPTTRQLTCLVDEGCTARIDEHERKKEMRTSNKRTNKRDSRALRVDGVTLPLAVYFLEKFSERARKGSTNSFRLGQLLSSLTVVWIRLWEERWSFK